MSFHSRRPLFGALTALAALTPAFGPAGRVRRVPAEYRTIQAALDSAAPGDGARRAGALRREHPIPRQRHRRRERVSAHPRPRHDHRAHHPSQRHPRQPRRVRRGDRAVSFGSDGVEQPDHRQHRRSGVAVMPDSTPTQLGGKGRRTDGLRAGAAPEQPGLGQWPGGGRPDRRVHPAPARASRQHGGRRPGGESVHGRRSALSRAGVGGGGCRRPRVCRGPRRLQRPRASAAVLLP